MSMKKIQVGIIGTGFGATVHAPILGLHEGFEVKAIASVYRGRSNDAFKEIEVNHIYTNWKEMLDKEELDLITICSVPSHHYEMTMESINKNVHVLCEKPLGISACQTSSMLEAQQNSNVMGFVNFQWRLTPERMKIKEMVSNNELGEIQYIKYIGSFSGYNSLLSQYRGWEGRRQDGGGFLSAVGSHMLDSLMWWMDQPISDVYADLKTLVPVFHGSAGIEQRDSDDAFTIMGHFENGIPFMVDVFYPAVRGNGWKLEIFGTRGTLVMNNDRDLMISSGGEFHNLQIEDQSPPSHLPTSANQYYRGLYPMVDQIYHSIVNQKVDLNVPTFADGHRVQLVMDAIYESAASQAMTLVKRK